MKIINKIILIWITGLVLTSCSDMFEPDPQNQQDLDQILNDPSWGEGVLLEAYRWLPNGYSMNEVATDDAVSNSPNNIYLRMASGEWSALFDPMSEWTTYDPIFNINFFLSVVDDVQWSWTSATANEYFASRFRGEAYALRALHYFNLLRNHGGIASNGDLLGVPIVTEVLTVEDDWRLPRDSFQDVVNQILSDIDAAVTLLPEEWMEYADSDSLRVFGPQNKNRVNGKVMKAFRSRVLLHAASPAFNGGSYDQAKAQMAAEETAPFLVAAGGADGLPSDGHLFYDEDGDINNPEIVWRTDFDRMKNLEESNFPPSKFGDGRTNPTQNFVDVFPMINGYPINDANSMFDPADPFANRDPRLAMYVIYNGNELGGDQIFTDVSSETDGINNLQESTRTGYYLKKLMREDVSLDPSNVREQRHFYTRIRMTELFLNYAEAANEAWGPDADPNGYGFTARDIVAAIRERAGIEEDDAYLASIITKEEMRQLIRDERRIELSFEGFRFWDLRRWDLPLNETAQGLRIDGSNFEVINVESRRYEPYMKFGPIPQNEVIKYNALLQNDGY